jgi:hypothetical protein
LRHSWRDLFRRAVLSCLRGSRLIATSRQFASQDFDVRLVRRIGVIAQNDVELLSAINPCAPAHRRVRGRALRRFTQHR